MGYPQLGDMGALPKLVQQIAAKKGLVLPTVVPKATIPQVIAAVTAAKLPAPMVVKPPVVTPTIPIAVRPTPAPTPVLPPPPVIRDNPLVNAIKQDIAASKPQIIAPLTPNVPTAPVVVTSPPSSNGVTASAPSNKLVDKLRAKAQTANTASLVARMKARAATAKGDTKAAATYDAQAVQLQTVAQQASAAVPVYAPTTAGMSLMEADAPADTTTTAPASPLAKLSKNPLAMLAGGGLLLLVVTKMGGHKSWR